MTRKPFVRAALRGTWNRDDWVGLALGLALLAVLGATDAGLEPDAPLIGSFVAAPLVCALFARASITLGIGLAALALAAASRQWHPIDSEGYWIALGIIAAGTAFAVASAWNRHRARVAGERLRILDAIATFADGSHPLDETLDRVTALIVPGVADICVIDAIHPGGVTTAAVRAEGHPSRAGEVEAYLRRSPLPLPKWLLTGERAWRDIPRFRPRIREEELRRMARTDEDFEFLSSIGIRSALVVPLSARDRNLGALTLISAWSRRRYSKDDVRFAQIAARRIGLALENAGLFSDLESVERRMDTVMSILDEAVTIHARDGELVFANPAAARAMGFETREELLAAPIERIGERLAVRDASGYPLAPEAFAGGPDADGRTPGPAILRVTDQRTRQESWFRRSSQAIEGPDGSALYLVTVFEDITDVKRAEFSQALLARTGELLASSTDYWATLDEVARIAVPELADWCAVNVPVPGGRIEQSAVADAGHAQGPAAEELRERLPIRTDEGSALAEAIRTGRARAFELDDETLGEIAADPEHLDLMRELGAGSIMIVPMTAGGRVVGAIAFVNHRSSRAFDESDLELAVELGRRAGLAIENARIAGERARVAETLQRELLPPELPEMEGWELATMYRPAGEMSEVGGDFYEAFAIDQRWVVVLGDITGHGALAASLTAVARHTIRAATAVASDPAVGLRTLDERLRERDAVALCSVALLVLPRAATDEEVEVEIWLAGHPPPLHLRNGTPREVGTPGPLVGIGEQPEWESETIALAPGEQLVVYTDGVIEAKHPSGDRFGADRLCHRLASCPEPSTAVARVESALTALSSEEPADDATLVAIRRRPADDASTGSGETRSVAKPRGEGAH
jgi:serine phosphatase RsbU (regulator of sigma subunit)/PAS domain-containing protein